MRAVSEMEGSPTAPCSNVHKGIYQKRVNLGAEIGGAISPPGPDGPRNPLRGTAGSYVNLTVGGVSYTCLLTCYHIVRPLLEGYCFELREEDGVVQHVSEPHQVRQLQKADIKGLNLQECLQLNFMKSPSRSKHHRHMADLSAEMDANSDGGQPWPELRQLMQTSKDLSESVTIGSAAS